jgi:hypothetical protein
MWLRCIPSSGSARCRGRLTRSSRADRRCCGLQVRASSKAVVGGGCVVCGIVQVKADTLMLRGGSEEVTVEKWEGCVLHQGTYFRMCWADVCGGNNTVRTVVHSNQASK